MEIRELINNICEAQHITYRDFCEKLSLNENDMDAILDKGMNMDVGEFKAICNAMDLPVETVIRFCEASENNKRIKLAEEFSQKIKEMAPKEKAYFDYFMDRFERDLLSGEININSDDPKLVAEKYMKELENNNANN